MLYDIIHGFGGHYKCRRRRPGHGGGGGGATNPALHLAPPPGTAGGRGGAADVGGIQYGIWALNQDRNCNTFSYL